MNNVAVENVRTLTLIGHASCGKTTLTEALLAATGAIDRRGSVEDKNTVSDATPEEHDRMCSIHAANVCVTHNGVNIFIADTPGYPDFACGVVQCLAASDAAALVIDAHEGIQTGTLRMWRMLEKSGLPRMIILTKFDKDECDFARLMEELQNTFGTGCVPVQIPVGAGASFTDVVDLLADDPGNADAALFETYHTTLVEGAAETREDIMEKYFSEGTLPKEDIITALKEGIKKATVIPVVICSALKDIGISALLDTCSAFLPSPVECGEYTTEDGVVLSPDPKKPAVARVFRTVTDPYVGQLTYLRVYQGTVTSGSEMQNQTRNHKERVGDLLLIHGKEHIKIAAATPGDIIAVAKLKNTHLNDTLGQQEAVFPSMEFPTPVVSYSVHATKRGEEEKISNGLHRICEEDPTVITERHLETHELLVSGLGDAHLDVVFKALKEKYHVDVETTTPKVAYHETIRGTADVRYRHKKQSGGAGQFAEVAIRLSPNERDKGYEFIDKIVGGVISNSFIPSVDKGIQARMKDGVMAGCQVVDIIVELYDGKEHPVDSKDIAFQIAGRHAIAEAIEKAQPILLEPIMAVEVHCPQQFMGDINGILNSKRGRIMGMDADGALQVVKAHVPQAEMFRFSSELSSITGGSGTFTMVFDHYEELPGNLAAEVIAAYKKSQQEAHE